MVQETLIKVVEEIIAKEENESKCGRRHIGCCIITMKGDIIHSNNSVDNLLCAKCGCIRDKLHIPSGTIHSVCFGIHAEAKTLLKAKEQGYDVKGAKMFCSLEPCRDCAQLIAYCKIGEFYFFNDYPEKEYEEIFKKNSIKFEHIE